LKPVLPDRQVSDHLHELPLPLQLAVLRGETTLEQAINETETPSPEEVERMLDGKPPKYSTGFTAWVPKPLLTASPQEEVRRLVPEKAVACNPQPPAAQPDTQQSDQAKRIANLEQRVNELEKIVVDLADRLAAKAVA
jgi:hypothetical protein